MSNSEFPSSNYSSGYENDNNIHAAPNENLSGTSLSPTCYTSHYIHSAINNSNIERWIVPACRCL